MRVVSTPRPEWLGRRYACATCGLVVEFELKDLWERKIRPYREAGRWIIGTPCIVCGPRRRFVEMTIGVEESGSRAVETGTARGA